MNNLEYRSWQLWQEKHNLQHLHIHKLQILFPYLNTYFSTPYISSKISINSIVVKNASDHTMLITWSNDKHNIKQHLFVYDKHIWLFAHLEQHQQQQQQQYQMKTIIYLCCQYSEYTKELVSYINPFTMLIGLRKQYRTVCKYQYQDIMTLIAMNEVDEMYELGKVDKVDEMYELGKVDKVNEVNNSKITEKVNAMGIRNNISICYKLENLISFEVADHDLGMLHTFNHKDIISITCWEPGKKNGVFRLHKIANDDVFKPESELVKAIYNSIYCVDVIKPDNDLYYFSDNINNIFHTFNSLFINCDVVNPRYTQPLVYKTLSKRRLRTATLISCVTELTSCISSL
jgi:hypothetical protein